MINEVTKSCKDDTLLTAGETKCNLRSEEMGKMNYENSYYSF